MGFEAVLAQNIAMLYGADSVTAAVPKSFNGEITTEKIRAELQQVAKNISENSDKFLELMGLSMNMLTSIASLENLEEMVENLVNSAQEANSTLLEGVESVSNSLFDSDLDDGGMRKKKYGGAFGFYGGYSFLKVLNSKMYLVLCTGEKTLQHPTHDQSTGGTLSLSGTDIYPLMLSK